MTMRSRFLFAGWALAALLVTGEVHAGQADHIRASGAWIRVLPGNLPAGGYVTLHNDAAQPAILRSVSSSAWVHVMLHQSSTAGGMSRMSMLDQLTIPAHGNVALAPSGYHLMLMDATRPVQPGNKVELTLKFDDGSTLKTDFLAKPANAE